MKSDLSFLGSIVRVIGAKIFVELTEDLPSSAPILAGKIYKVGQIGSFVRVPLGNLNIYGIVTMVGANPLDVDNSEPTNFPYGKRWLEIQLIGESIGNKDFQRGVSTYPTIDDEVHVVTNDDLKVIHSTDSPNSINIGTLASSDNLSAFIDIDKFLSRHTAIVGSTGSGKSNAVTSILRAITSSGFPKSKVILIDPHSEYHSALKDYAKIFSLDDNQNALKVPFWGLSYNELALVLFDKKQAADTSQDLAIQEEIIKEKRAIASKLKCGKVDEEYLTVDLPIPFNIKKIWYDLYNEEHATVMTKQDLSTAAFIKVGGADQKGDQKRLIAPKFMPPGAGSAAPFKFKENKILVSYLNKLHTKLKDNRLGFLFDVDEFNGVDLDIDDLLASWLNHDKPITVLDLGGVPFEIMDMVVGLISRIVFESFFWGRNIPGFGRQRPLLMVYEEAHSYLPKGGSSQTVSGYASRAVRRICKEGRKYGIGALVVSQRPSDLDETILSQCGTFMALRLSNSEDQSIIGAAMPDNLGSLSELLPSLRTGEAIIVGEAVKIPSRVRLPLIDPRPDSKDPEPSKLWREDAVKDPEFKKAVQNWRKQKIEKDNS
ncbi:MAG TPA: DUF853 domain-containing protein [Cytophagales bacterium]|jgi:uncharacterized protein|nr:DUF853 domain-containing protein [Cytophagales bacterium]